MRARTLVENNINAVVEGANMPLTAKAQNVILDNDIIFGPAKAANAGGVAVSGYERSQNASLRNWDLETVESELKNTMQEIHDRCCEFVERENQILPYRKGANIYSFKKLADTLVQYGIK